MCVCVYYVRLYEIANDLETNTKIGARMEPEETKRATENCQRPEADMETK